MKQPKIIFFAITILSLASCQKNTVLNTKEKPDYRSIADTISMTVSQVVSPVLDDTEEDHVYHSACYQLADATRAVMTTAILDYIYTTMLDKVNNPIEGEPLCVYYEDLFAEFPNLEGQIDEYLNNTDYGITHEYNDFVTLAAAFEWQGVDEDPAIWMPNITDLPANHSPSVTNYVIAAPIQIDLEDIDSEDKIFGWNCSEGTTTTISIGESVAAVFATGTGSVSGGTGVYLSGSARAKGTEFDPPPPVTSNNPPFSTNNPWGPSNSAQINRIKIDQRYERNKKSEVRKCTIWGKYDGTYLGNDGYKVHVKDVHKNDVWTDVWISPVWLCPMINNTDDLVYIYNLYESDWYAVGNNWYMGGLLNTSGSWGSRLWVRMEHSNEYYMTYRDNNHQKNLWERVGHQICHTIWTNGNTTHTGKGGGQALISKY